MPGSKLHPLVKLQNNKKNFFENISEEVIKKINIHTHSNISEQKILLENTIESELRRFKKNRYNIDHISDQQFWEALLNNLDSLSSEDLNKINKKIIFKYLNEINCDIYPKFAKFCINLIGNIFAFFFTSEKFTIGSLRNKLSKAIIFTGEVDLFKKLIPKGTIVLLPTHTSHIDSILVGAIPYFVSMKIPVYGAGLNLYQNKIARFIMSKIGTYTIDRRKKNFYYLQTIKSYSKYILKNDCNSIFYPGGTRSRSGAIETKLKLGLLSTVIDAQVELIKEQKDKHKKIFLVPITLSSDNIIESSNLIRQFLGLKKIKLSFFEKIKLLLKNLKYSKHFAISIGHPIDIYGNKINEKGNSVDLQNNILSLSQILKKNNFEYNNNSIKDLESQILAQFKAYNYIFLGQFIAYVVFRLIKKKFNHVNEDDFWKMDKNILFVSKNEAIKKCLLIIDYIKKNKIKILIDSKISKLLNDKIIERALKSLGASNSKKVLLIKNNNFVTEDLATLYYYHNKMIGYGFEQCFR